MGQQVMPNGTSTTELPAKYEITYDSMISLMQMLDSKDENDKALGQQILEDLCKDQKDLKSLANVMLEIFTKEMDNYFDARCKVIEHLLKVVWNYEL